MKSLNTLAKQLEFKRDIEYWDYCITSYANGQFTQCRKLFFAMKKADRKGLLDYISGCYDYPEQTDVYQFYFKLL